MPMIKKSITVTDQQDVWIKAQIKSGHYGNESEIFRDMIRERQIREQDSQARIDTIEAALIEGEQSGISERTLDEIWQKARQQRKP